ncbi:hypothetical protein lerEdw1_021154 [Lerista edwardsae]|nr:hypothetical protein lerEdw1_021155 [Lerista edwardsae]KAJ6651249.1 hypothetical protein lerEdw1_021154 [Lerista edwardsae]
MNSYNFEPDQQFTRIKGTEQVWNKAQEAQEENDVSQEKMDSRGYGEEAEELHPISFGRLPGGGGDEIAQSAGEGEKHLVLLKTIHLKLEDNDFQGADPPHPQYGLQAMIQQEGSILQPTEMVSPAENVQENPEESWAINLLEGIYTIHEMEVMHVNSLKEAQVLNEDKRSTKKASDVVWIKVAGPLD